MGNRQFDRQTLISAVTNRSIMTLTSLKTDPLPPNTYERHVFFSPKNTVSRIINARLVFQQIQQTGLTGNRDIIIDNYISDTSGLGIFRGTCTDLYGDFMFDQGTFQLGSQSGISSISFVPNDLAAINNNIRNLQFDEFIGLSLVFRHSIAGKNVTEPRSVTLFVEQEVVAR